MSNTPDFPASASPLELQHRETLFTRSIAVGLCMAVAMWAAWVLVHHPASNLSPTQSGPILLGFGFVAGILVMRRLGSQALPIGAIAGLIAGAITLACVSSLLTKQADPAAGPVAGEKLVEGGDRPPLPMLIGGFLAATTVLGLLAGVVSQIVAERKTPQNSVKTAAWATLIATVPLVVLGGLVTSTRSGLAVPDWPGTYGGNMFLYPISLMASNSHVFFEHSHRLFGVLVGLAAILTVVLAFMTSASKPVRVLACTTLAVVIIQGVLGGLRVSIPDSVKAPLHGILAQLAIGLVGLTAAAAGFTGEGSQTSEAQRRLRGLATALVHTTVLQVIMGAIYRHTGQTHALYTHIAISFAVLGLGLVVGFRATILPDSSMVRTAGKTLVTLVTLQFLLGWVAVMVASPSIDRKVPTAEQLPSIEKTSRATAAIRTAHQANGAFLMASACFVLAHCKRGPKVRKS